MSTTSFRDPARLSEHFDRRVAACAAMAGALALGADVATADVVASAVMSTVVGLGYSVGIDIDSDGAIDVTIYNSTSFGVLAFGAPTVHNGVPAYAFIPKGGFHYMDNLPAGTLIGSTSTFGSYSQMYNYSAALSPKARGEFSTLGGFPEVGKATGNYIGVKFTKYGYTYPYYGWISLDLSGSTPTITRWAFDDISGTAIAAGDIGAVPEPASATLAMLALGASSIAGWRRRRANAALIE